MLKYRIKSIIASVITTITPRRAPHLRGIAHKLAVLPLLTDHDLKKTILDNLLNRMVKADTV